MTWTEPLAIEVKMDAELTAYQMDDPDPWAQATGATDTPHEALEAALPHHQAHRDARATPSAVAACLR